MTVTDSTDRDASASSPAPPPEVSRRSAARQAAVQLVYGALFHGDTAEDGAAVLRAFAARQQAEGRDALRAMKIPARPEKKHLEALVLHAIDHAESLDAALHTQLKQEEDMARMPAISHALFRVALAELDVMRAIPAPVIVAEYMTLARQFLDAADLPFINAVLDGVATTLRGE